MEHRWKHIIEPSVCPSEQTLWLYLQNQLDDNAKFEVEHHLAGCEMCTVALEGLSQLTNFSVVENTDTEIQEKIHTLLEKKEKRKALILTYRRFAVASSILLIVGISISVYFFKTHNVLLKNEVAVNLEKPKEPLKEKITETEKTTPEPKRIVSMADVPKRSMLKTSKFKAPVVVDTVASFDMVSTLAPATLSDMQTNSVELADKEDLSVSDNAKDEKRSKETPKQLDEVVVVGYGVQKKSSLSGAVASVKAAESITVSDSDAGLQLNRALKLVKAGDTLTALDQIKDITKTNRKYVAAWHNLTILYLSQHDKNNVIKSLTKLQKLANSDRTKKKINEALKLSKEDKLDEALKKMRELKPEEY